MSKTDATPEQLQAVEELATAVIEQATSADLVDGAGLASAINAAFTHTKLTRQQAHAKVLEIAAEFKEIITGKDGTYSTEDECLMAKHLPAGVTTEHLSAGDETQRLVTAGILRAQGELALKDMVDNPELVKATGTYNLRPGLDVTLHHKRSEVHPGMVRDGVKGPDTTKYATTRVVFAHEATDASAGEIGKARVWLNEAGLEALGALGEVQQ